MRAAKGAGTPKFRAARATAVRKGAPAPALHGERAPRSVARRTARGDDTVVELRDIDCQVHIGVDEQERSAPQRLIVDLALEGNMAGSDGAACGALVQEIRSLLAGGRFVLLEATILRIARLAFRRSPARRVSVRLRKFVLPETDYVAVEMSLRRSEVRRPRQLPAGAPARSPGGPDGP